MRNAAATASSRTRTAHPFTRLLGWAGFGLLIAMLWLGQSGPSQARLDPYFVVRGDAFGTITPRVLFVLDTSGSMSRRAASVDEVCRWSRCENAAFYESEDPDDQSQVSRLYAARRAIEEVVEGAGDAASFAFMSFVQNGPETQDPPPLCDNLGEATRFVPTTLFRDWSSGWLWISRQEPLVPPQLDYAGGLRLCQGDARRPYPYIRWDELQGRTAGGVSINGIIGANNQVGPVPPSPLISLDAVDYISTLNVMRRRVQFFPQFMGVRAQLNATTDPSQDILNATVGDYDRVGEVWNNDFYYWPYVDGFSGYGTQDLIFFDPIAGIADWFDGAVAAGVAGDDDWFEGVALHAPFFVDLSATTVPSDNWGPADEDQALDLALARTAPLVEGGVDAVGGTPWADAVGEIPATPPEDNRVGSHSSVASYLSFLATVADTTACAPTNVVLLTDGAPNAGQGGATLYERLAALRNDLDAAVYVVGFFIEGGELNNMACAGAGACAGGAGCGSPCDDDPADEWDTCADPDNPDTDCAYVANSTDELQAVLASIIDNALEIEVPSGQGAVINEFGAAGLADGTVAVQTVFTARTDYPGWQGHVERRYCEVYDGGSLVDTCVPPSPEFPPEVSTAFDTFGPCDMSRDWDAGECLQMMAWNDRRLYSHDASNNVYRISNPDGTASAPFIAELMALGHVSGPDADDDADEIVAFLLGRDAADGWKLPGVSNSAPITIRRVPQYDDTRLPEVAITDPHCAGRRFGELDAGTLPDTLEDFARDAWAEAEEPNYTYQEAVVVGDDFGIIHAFQMDSGNELFGLIPRFALENAVEQAANGAANMGQPSDDLEDHIFGISSTLNHGWAFDSDAGQWRHLGVIGMGAGGHEYIALDLSHMNPDAGVPVEVMWTTEDPTFAADYDDMLGETWARPALTYHTTNDQIGLEPETFLVAGSGYPDGSGGPDEGRVLFVANAMTGEILERAIMPAVAGPVYESTFGAVVDPAVGSHCISRYWAEGQETYVADPAGRLFRWDLGRDTAPLTFKHTHDSGAGPWAGSATEAFRFPACTGTGDSCTVSPGNEGDPFLFAPAVSAFNRIDDATAGVLADVEENDHFLVAMVSGSPFEDTLDGGDETNDFHSSLYLLVDDRDASGPPGPDSGFSIPTGAPKSGGSFGAGDAVSGNPSYMRIAVSDITRTREVTPFEGAPTFTETRNFSKAARPIRAPRIFVTGVADDSGDEPLVVQDVEVYYVTYYIFEPGAGECDPRFYDAANRTWHPDRGSTYEVTFRLTADVTTGFEFNNGASGGGALAEFEAGFDTGLQLVSVEQESSGSCDDGNCGATVTPEAFVPCDNNAGDEDPAPIHSFAIPTGSKTLDAFTPVEN
ncbi:MAG: hypothetical protein ACE37F_10565 [Nannocystaceae bacterium]|nr:hypothetical protein [bacterium]